MRVEGAATGSDFYPHNFSNGGVSTLMKQTELRETDMQLSAQNVTNKVGQWYENRACAGLSSRCAARQSVETPRIAEFMDMEAVRSFIRIAPNFITADTICRGGGHCHRNYVR